MISIIMPTYNCARFIAKSIESVLAQTYTDWELLIVDDCSTDNTISVVQPYLRDTRIHYFTLEHNSGAAIARNKALREAKGQYIAFLDSDDLWLPEKLQKQIDFMETNHYDFTYHDYTEIDEQDQPLRRYISGKQHVRKLDMYMCCWPGCLSVMYNRESIGLIQIEDIKKNNDTALWLKVIQHSDCYLLPESLALYRRRKGSITPPSIFKRISAHYPLFHDAEHMSAMCAWFWVSMNIVGNGIKKCFYTRNF